MEKCNCGKEPAVCVIDGWHYVECFCGNGTVKQYENEDAAILAWDKKYTFAEYNMSTGKSMFDVPKIPILSRIKTWVKHGFDSHKRSVIWFKSGKEKPTNIGNWEYLCDGKLSEQELDRFMTMYRTLISLN